MGFGGSPSMPPPPPPPPPPTDDDEELARLARQRAALEKKRTGRGSLRIEPSRNPGVAVRATPGLRIPTA